MKDNSILVVGAKSDIGAALIKHLNLVRPELRIFGHARIPQPESIENEGSGIARWFYADLANTAAVERMGREIVVSGLVPRGIVFLPGLPLKYERITKFDFDHFLLDLEVQVQGPISLLKALLPAMLRLDNAKLVFVGSSVTRGLPPKHLSMYSIVKYAQMGLMKSLAAEYAGTSLQVNSISPSMVETKFLRGIPASLIEGVAAGMPGKRNITTSDIVSTIAFLLDDRCQGMTGTDLPITGGSVI